MMPLYVCGILGQIENHKRIGYARSKQKIGHKCDFRIKKKEKERVETDWPQAFDAVQHSTSVEDEKWISA